MAEETKNQPEELQAEQLDDVTGGHAKAREDRSRR